MRTLARPLWNLRLHWRKRYWTGEGKHRQVRRLATNRSAKGRTTRRRSIHPSIRCPRCSLSADAVYRLRLTEETKDIGAEPLNH